MKGWMTLRWLGMGILVVLVVTGCAVGATQRSAPIVDRGAVPLKSPRPASETVIAPRPPPPAQVKTAPLVPPSSGIISEPLASQPNRTIVPPTAAELAPSRSGSPPVLALLDNAAEHQRGGRLDGAAAALERALRIAPQNPVIWQRLAELRLQQKRYDQAIQLATKANSLAVEDRLLQARNWRVIAQARDNKGDKQGAQAARDRVSDLESDGF